MARVARVISPMVVGTNDTNLPCPVDVLPVMAGLAKWLVGWPVIFCGLSDGDLFIPCGWYHITFAVPQHRCCWLPLADAAVGVVTTIFRDPRVPPALPPGETPTLCCLRFYLGVPPPTTTRFGLNPVPLPPHS